MYKTTTSTYSFKDIKFETVHCASSL